MDAILAEVRERGIGARVEEAEGRACVILESPPEDLAVPAGVERAASIDVPEGRAMTRRAFLDAFAMVAAASAAGAAAVATCKFIAPPPPRSEVVDEVDVASVSELELRGAKPFRFGREPAIVVRGRAGYFALSTVCTHLGCVVEWDAAANRLTCPCHLASFNLEGSVAEGPPPRPLATFAVSIRGDRIVVRRRTA